MRWIKIIQKLYNGVENYSYEITKYECRYKIPGYKTAPCLGDSYNSALRYCVDKLYRNAKCYNNLIQMENLSVTLLVMRKFTFY